MITSFIVLHVAYSPVSIMTSVKLSPTITTLVNIFLYLEENCVVKSLKMPHSDRTTHLEENIDHDDEDRESEVKQ